MNDVIEKSMRTLEHRLRDSPLHVKHVRGSLWITVGGVSRVLIDGHTIPCFSTDVPEMMITFIVSQLAKILKADDGRARQCAVTLAVYEIESKLVVLHALSDTHYGTVRST